MSGQRSEAEEEAGGQVLRNEAMDLCCFVGGERLFRALRMLGDEATARRVEAWVSFMIVSFGVSAAVNGSVGSTSGEVFGVDFIVHPEILGHRAASSTSVKSVADSRTRLSVSVADCRRVGGI